MFQKRKKKLLKGKAGLQLLLLRLLDRTEALSEDTWVFLKTYSVQPLVKEKLCDHVLK